METADPAEQLMGLFWSLRLEDGLPAAVAPGIAATFTRATLEESSELAAVMGFDDVEPVEQRFERGCHCYLARVEGRLVGYGWISFDQERIGELGLSVHLLAGEEAYIWDCATLADYRGQRLYPALLSAMLRQLSAAGYRRVWIGMDADNKPSQAGVARAGFQLIVALLLAHPARGRTFLIRGYPGVSQEDVQDAQYALLGDRNARSITLA